MATVAAHVADCLRAIGVARVFGRELPGLPGVAIDDPRAAALLADADGRLGPGPGAALLPNGALRITSRPGAAPERVVVRDPHLLARAVRDAAPDLVPRAAVVQLEVDLDADAPAEARPLAPAGAPAMGTLPMARGEVVVLAGPGVTRAGAVDDLHALARRCELGVLNTWGAKGLFRYDDPYHLGTAGLQADDFALAGLGDADLVVASGLDPDEAPPAAIALAPLVAYDPRHLGWLVRSGALQSARAPERPELFERIGAVARPGYDDTHTPLHPARAVADLRATVPDGCIVAGEAGHSGLWLARTFPTTAPGSVVVPATRAPGIAVALAIVAALRGHPAVAVTDAPTDDATRAMVALAQRLEVDVVVEVWGPGGHVTDTAEHRARLAAALNGGGTTVLGVPVDFSRTDELVAAAGPVTAWGGLRNR